MNTLEVARTLVGALEDKKAENILLLDVHEIASFTDYFIVCSGTSDRMLDALAKAVLEKIDLDFDMDGRVEGSGKEGWVLVDLGDIIIHLFSEEQRDYYRLEQLWERGKVLIRLQ